jgi:uncharacterized protein YkwD
VKHRQRTQLICLTLTVATLATVALAGDIETVDYLTERESNVLREINIARTQPHVYVSYIEAWIERYDGNLRKLPDRIPVMTKEGIHALREAIAFLEQVEPVRALRSTRGLSYAARDHVRDMGPSGAIGHRGYDDSGSSDRANRYGKWVRKVAENIAYGSDDPREIVMRLIIDDGIKSRGHRKNIFDDDFYAAGVSFGYHDEFETMTVIMFAGDYLE